jgi:hypothetical protein
MSTYDETTPRSAVDVPDCATGTGTHDYEPPCIERLVQADDLEQERLYAGFLSTT